jgi:hypothetical protein
LRDAGDAAVAIAERVDRDDVQAAVAAGDSDGAGAPAARALVLLEGAGVKVKVEDDSVEPVEAGVSGHHADVLQRPRVAGDGEPVLVVGARPLFTADDRDRVLSWNVEAFDRG